MTIPPPRNRPTLDDIAVLEITAIAALPVEVLALLQEEADAALATAKAVKERLDGALGHKYGAYAADLRRQAGKDAGTVRFPDGNHVVIADLPKRVRWDQDQLREALRTLESWKENPREYVALEIKVAESRYEAWPTAIRSLFAPARTLATGKPSFKLERRPDAV